MSQRTMLLTIAMVTSLLCQLQAEVIDSNWVGGAGLAWSNPLNWQPQIVPTNSGDRKFRVNIHAATGPEEIVFVNVDGVYETDSLHISGTGTIIHAASFDPINLFIKNELSNNGEFEIINLNIDGELRNLENGEMDIVGEVGTFWGNIENHGHIEVSPASELWTFLLFENFGDLAMKNAECGAETTFDNKGVVTGSGILYGDWSFINSGRIQTRGGDLMLDGDRFLINTGELGNTPNTSLHVTLPEPLNNQGLIRINAGGGVTIEASLVNEPNATVNLLGGILAATTITQKPGATFQGFGGITGDVVIDPNALIKLTGPTNIVGDVEIKPNATLEISDGTTLITGQTTCNGTIHLKGGRIIPQGGLSGTCNIVWEPGLYTNVADFNLDGKVNIQDFALFADTWLWQTAWD